MRKKGGSTVETALRKAYMEILILTMISEKDTYGYEICQELKKRSAGEYILLEGSMYPILYRLEENCLISSREEKVGKRMTRIYYHLESSGKEYLEQQKIMIKRFIEMADFLVESNPGDVYKH